MGKRRLSKRLVVNREVVHQVRQIHSPARLAFPSRTSEEGILPLRQVRLLLRLCKLPFALLKTTAVIPFTVLVYGVNGIAVLHGLEAPRTLLVLEIVGKLQRSLPVYIFTFLDFHIFGRMNI